MRNNVLTCPRIIKENVLKPDFKADVLYRSKVADADGKLAMMMALCGVAVAVPES